MAVPWIMPAAALGRDDAIPPADRVTLGIIGAGGRGTSNMRAFLPLAGAQVVAVCDVKRDMRNRASKIVAQKYEADGRGNGKPCDAYNDFRELLGREDIDAVVISPQDHWHAAIAVSAAYFKPAWAFLDGIGAILVCVFILHASLRIVLPGVQQLIDRGADFDEVAEIRAIALSQDGVKEVHAVRTRYVGSGLQVDLHVKVDPDMTVREGHAIAEEVTRRLIAEGPDVLDVVVHTEPYRGPE